MRQPRRQGAAVGESQSPSNSGQDIVEGFAAALRAERITAGEPTFRQMANAAGFSKDTLARAAQGRSLPSWEVTEAYVRVCGGDAVEWRRRWEQARQELEVRSRRSGEPEQADQIGAENPGRRAGRLRLSGRIAALLLGAASLIANVVLVLDRTDHAAPKAEPGTVQDGSDPKQNHCSDDASDLDKADVVLSGATQISGRDYPAGTVLGHVSLRFSARCAAAWSRFDLVDEIFHLPSDADLTMQTVRTSDGAAVDFKLGHIDQGYANLLLTGMGCVQAQAVVTVSGSRATATGVTRCLPKY